MTEAQRDAIALPVIGLLIFQIDGTTGFYYYSGAGWVPVHTGSATLPLSIGDTGPAGGVVFYLANPPRDLNGDGTADAGLECALTDLGPAEWGCYGTSVSGATGTVIGTGAQNTAAILAGCSTLGIAARLCDAYSITYNGTVYDDWFLPSISELNLMYGNLHSNVVGGFAFNYYWSSSEYVANLAWLQYFNFGYHSGNYKNSTYSVRAVRAF